VVRGADSCATAPFEAATVAAKHAVIMVSSYRARTACTGACSCGTGFCGCCLLYDSCAGVYRACPFYGGAPEKTAAIMSDHHGAPRQRQRRQILTMRTMSSLELAMLITRRVNVSPSYALCPYCVPSRRFARQSLPIIVASFQSSNVD
jgi:hypothetical protein